MARLEVIEAIAEQLTSNHFDYRRWAKHAKALALLSLKAAQRWIEIRLLHSMMLTYHVGVGCSSKYNTDNGPWKLAPCPNFKVAVDCGFVFKRWQYNGAS